MSPKPTVSLGIVTWNSAATIERCIGAVRRLEQPVELLVVDNASTDGTTTLLRRLASPEERVELGRNVGFAAGHNLAIRRTGGDFYLALNPDVFVSPSFVTRLVEALGRHPEAGSASGKLLRAEESGCIDSAGVYLVPSQRHFDRGAGEPDAGQYDAPAYVFGASGAAAFYRRRMLEDAAVEGEVFDEAFFAYREDVDLAWRAQVLGWSCVYEPRAVAWHVRRVTPERRGDLPAELNRYSVRNRFLLRLNNQPLGQALRFAVPALWRDAQVIGYVLLREHTSIPALADVVRLLPRALRRRRAILSRRRAPQAELDVWFRTQSLATDGTKVIGGLRRGSPVG